MNKSLKSVSAFQIARALLPFTRDKIKDQFLHAICIYHAEAINFTNKIKLHLIKK